MPNHMTNKNFCASFSSGKDSILAIDRLINAGYQPTSLITSVSQEINRSWFHGVPLPILDQIASSLNIPCINVQNTPENYQEKMVAALKQAKQAGADFCCFGDIDIEANGAWDRQISLEAGLTPLLPLWQQDRRAIVEAFLSRGYTAIIKTVSKESKIPQRFLGCALDEAFITYLEEHHLDVCGENGEYHTLVIDGPLFNERINYSSTGIFETQYAYSLIIE